jgi:Na+/melibiose symporter-like transporter
MPNKGFTVELRRGYKCLVRCCNGGYVMSIGLILVIILVIFLLGGISGRFGGYGYGYGHGGIGVIGVVLIILVVLLLMGRL